MKELKFASSEMIVSKTDIQGRITYGNKIFLDLSGYSEKEVIGSKDSILKHENMPKVIYKYIADTLQAGKEVNAYIINKTKQNDFYWGLANITPSLSVEGKVIGYYSVIRQASATALNVIKPFYSNLIKAEKEGGIESSNSLLNKTLKQNGVKYNEYILSM